MKIDWMLLVLVFVAGIVMIRHGILLLRSAPSSEQEPTLKLVGLKDQLKPGRLGLRFLTAGLALAFASLGLGLYQVSSAALPAPKATQTQTAP